MPNPPASPHPAEPLGPAPTISVVTVTFNSARTLGDTIASVRSQTHPHVEHVIVDGGSTDHTVDLARTAAAEPGARLIWVSEPDQGIYDAMNKGIAMATGDIIGVLNSDDFFADDQVLSDVAARFAATGCEALYADLVYVDEFDTSTSRRAWRAGTGRVERGWSPPHPTLYLTRELYRRFGSYKTDYRISSDYDYALRIWARGSGVRTAYLDRVIVSMRQGGVSTRNLNGNRVGFREAQQSLREQGFRFPRLVNLARVARKLVQLRSPRTVVGR